MAELAARCVRLNLAEKLGFEIWGRNGHTMLSFQCAGIPDCGILEIQKREYQCFEMGSSRHLFLSCTGACGRRGKLGCCGEARCTKAFIHRGVDVVCTYGSGNSQGVKGLLLKAWRRRGM